MAPFAHADLHKRLADPDADTPEAAADILRLAVRGWQQTMVSAVFDRPDALVQLDLVSQALGEWQRCLGAVLPEIVKQAAPLGKTLQERLAERQQVLAEGQLLLDMLKQSLAPLLELENQLGPILAQQAALEARLKELRHIQALGEQVDALRAQVEQVEQHLTAAEQSAGQSETRLVDLGGRLLVLDERQLALLRQALADTLRRADQAEAEIRQVSSDLSAARERYEQARLAITEQHRQTLALYLEADRVVCQALHTPSASGVQAVLDEAQRLVDQAEAALGKAIQANTLAQALPHLTV